MGKVFPFLDATRTIHHERYQTGVDTRSAGQERQVVCTGAAGGIASQVVNAFADAGTRKLFLIDRNLEALTEVARHLQMRHPNIEVQTYAVNLCQKNSIEDLQAVSQDLDQKMDLVVLAAAGILGKFADVADSNPITWWQTFDVNLNALYITCRAFLPHMIKAKVGTIINFSSMGCYLTNAGGSAYYCSKAAVTRFTEFLDLEYREQGVRSFCIHPGNIPTGLALSHPPEYHDLLIDSPTLCTDLCLYLTNPRADFLRGRFVSANWDILELEGRRDEVMNRDLLKMRLLV